MRTAPGPERRLSRVSSGRRPWWAGPAVHAPPAVRLDWQSAGGRAVLSVAGDLNGGLRTGVYPHPLQP